MRTLLFILVIGTISNISKEVINLASLIFQNIFVSGKEFFNFLDKTWNHQLKVFSNFNSKTELGNISPNNSNCFDSFKMEL